MPSATSQSRSLAVITGASSGIGEVFARRLAPTHDLLLVARREAHLRALAAELSATHRTRAQALSLDLERTADLDTLAGRFRTEPAFELLVNNAGFGVDGPFWEGTPEPQERMHELHVMATLRLCHAALGVLVARNRGAVINVASVAAFIHGPGSCGYSATKSWMTAFTEGLHLDLVRAGSAVRVQALCPGFTYTEFHDVMGVRRESRAPRSFWLTPESVVDASLKGLGKGRVYVVPGWRYQLLTAIVTRLPHGMRMALESARGRGRKA
jgi:short-subunit dehydrogenase